MDSGLGIDVGSVTTKCAIITGVGEFIATNYLYTQGKPVSADSRGSGKFRGDFPLMSGSLVDAPQNVARWKAGYILAHV